jgi:hypothetical protein
MSRSFLVTLHVTVIVKAGNPVIAKEKALTHSDDYLRQKQAVIGATVVRELEKET